MALDQLPDADLVERTRRGDGSAFGVLVRRHYRAAFAVALALAGERADAEDACQDSFLRALERIEECREPDRFAAWLLTIVRSRTFNLIDRRRVRSTVPLEDVDAVAAGGAEEDLARRELGERLTAALATLTETQRQVVLLHDLHGWKHRAIAESIGCSEGMSRQHLFIARRLLRERLGTFVLREYTSDE